MKHGTQTCYRHGCRCGVCRNSHSEYMRRWRAEGPQLVDSTEVTAHVEHLRECGMTDRAIGAASGGVRGAVYNITTRRSRCSRRVAEGILAVTPDDHPDCHLVDSCQSRTLLATILSCDCTPGQLERIANRKRGWVHHTMRRTRVQMRTHRRICVLYELLARQGIVPASVLEEVS